MKTECIVAIAVILIVILISTDSEKLNPSCPKLCRNTNDCCYGFHCRKRNCVKVCNINGEPCKRNRECCKRFTCKNNVCA